MKIYISADMEGITGVTHWDEVDHNKPPYSYFQEQKEPFDQGILDLDN